MVPVLNEAIRIMCDKETSDSKYLFGENLLENMSILLVFQIVLSTTPIPNFRKLITSQALCVLLGTQILVLVRQSFCFPFFKLQRPQKEPSASRTVLRNMHPV